MAAPFVVVLAGVATVIKAKGIALSKGPYLKRVRLAHIPRRITGGFFVGWLAGLTRVAPRESPPVPKDERGFCVPDGGIRCYES